MNGWELGLSTVVALLGAGGGLKLIEALTRGRGPAKAEAAATVIELTLKSTAAIAADAEVAHNKLRQMGVEADKLSAQVREDREEMRSLRLDVTRLSNEVQAAADRLRHWRRAILSPEATLAALRQMVSVEPGENGHGS